jgi:DNA-binding NarL/FixJ family response regulator
MNTIRLGGDESEYGTEYSMRRDKSFFVIHPKVTILDLLSETISIQPRCLLSGKSSSLEESLGAINDLKPDFVLLNIDTQQFIDGNRVFLESMRLNSPGAKVVGLTDYDQDFRSTPFLHTVLSTNSPLSELRRNLSDIVNRDDEDQSSMIHRNSVKARNSAKAEHPLLKLITAREREVIRLIASSHSNKQVAIQLGLSVKTVENHRANLMRKIEGNDTASLVRFAIRTGLISLAR